MPRRIERAAAPPAVTGEVVPNLGLTTFFLALSSLLVTLDATIANIALPHVMGSISAAPDQITWVITSYIVAAAVTLPMSGWLASRFGIKPVLLVSIAGFTLASMLCGTASSLAELVAFRLLQGMFGAPLMPLTQAQLFDLYPPERHGKAMAVYGLGGLMGPIIGPTVGGYVTDHFSWRWIFYLNVPLGAVVFLGLLLLLNTRSRAAPRAFDLFGFAALVVFVASLQLVLDRGPHLDWFHSGEIWTEAVLSAMALWVFVAHSATAKAAFFSPALMRDRTFIAMGAFGFFGYFLLNSTSAFVPLMLQSAMGYPAMTTGMLLIPRGLGAIVGTVAAGRLLGRVDARVLLLAGLVICALSLWSTSRFDLMMGRGPILATGVFQGMSFGLIMVPASTSAFATLAASLRPEGAALLSMMRNIGGSIGIAVMQGLLARNLQAMHASLAAHVVASDPLLAQAAAGGLALVPTAALAIDAEINRQAAMVAYLDDFRVMCFIALACIPLLIIVRKPRPRGGDPVHAAAR